MIQDITFTRSLYEVCRDLFAGYPLAVRVDACGARTVRSMVLMHRDGGDARFLVLSDHRGKPGFSVYGWPVGEIVEIGADGGLDVPDTIQMAVRYSVPIPRDGSLFGWSDGRTITALVAVYATYTPVSPQPSWTVMPLVGVPQAQWPSFTGERFFGGWFWEHYQAGNIISLSGLIAATPDTAFWVDTEAVLGSDCCAVARDINDPRGYKLPCGRYVYYEALQTGKPVPPLSALLADAGKTDLAPRFQQFGQSEGLPPDGP
jgi:hypothetical protein